MSLGRMNFSDAWSDSCDWWLAGLSGLSSVFRGDLSRSPLFFRGGVGGRTYGSSSLDSDDDDEADADRGARFPILSSLISGGEGKEGAIDDAGESVLLGSGVKVLRCLLEVGVEYPEDESAR